MNRALAAFLRRKGITEIFKQDGKFQTTRQTSKNAVGHKRSSLPHFNRQVLSLVPG